MAAWFPILADLVSQTLVPTGTEDHEGGSGVDGRSFDALTKVLARHSRRRTLLQSALSGTLTAVLPGRAVEVEAAKRRGCKKQARCSPLSPCGFSAACTCFFSGRRRNRCFAGDVECNTRVPCKKSSDCQPGSACAATCCAQKQCIPLCGIG